MTTHRQDKETFECIFCKKTKREGLKLIGGNGVYVCEECIRNSYALLQKISDEDQRRSVQHVPKPAEIKKVLDEYIIAQDRAKRVLSVAVYSHFRRLESSEKPGGFHSLRPHRKESREGYYAPSEKEYSGVELQKS